MMKIFFKIYWRKPKPLSELDKNDIVIKWGDALISHTNHLGHININSLVPESLQNEGDIRIWRSNIEGELRTAVLNKLVITPEDVNMPARVLSEYIEAIKNHLRQHGYIEASSTVKGEWVISDKGKEMKTLGGHYEFQDYERSKINIVRNQSKINNLLILATFMAAVMPFFAAWLFQTKVYNSNIVPQQVFRPDIRIDSAWLNQQVDGLIQKKLSSQQQQDTTATKLPK